MFGWNQACERSRKIGVKALKAFKSLSLFKHLSFTANGGTGIMAFNVQKLVSEQEQEKRGRKGVSSSSSSSRSSSSAASLPFLPPPSSQLQIPAIFLKFELW